MNAYIERRTKEDFAREARASLAAAVRVAGGKAVVEVPADYAGLCPLTAGKRVHITANLSIALLITDGAGGVINTLAMDATEAIIVRGLVIMPPDQPSNL